MNREVRRVPVNWEHPRDANGRYIPLLDDFTRYLSYWKEAKKKWDEGFFKILMDQEEWRPKERYMNGSWEEREGPCPKQENYMPDWTEEERTHYQMYETTSEGTPISPVMETPEDLARWLADNHASAFADITATYEQWLCIIKEKDI